LVVANQTLGGEVLATHLRRVIEGDPGAHFVVMVPLSSSAALDVGGAMGVMGGLAMIDLELQDQLAHAAQERLRRLLAWLHDAGAEAKGSLVGDPMAAMEEAVAQRPVDEIIISTLPARVSQWLRLDLPHRAARRFSVPITTVTAIDESMPPVPGAATDETSRRKQGAMAESVYKIIELVGTSPESWEKAAAAAVTKASQTLRDLRVAEIVELDMVIDEGAVTAYRAKIKVSFKYEGA
jgi:hypothetical protein